MYREKKAAFLKEMREGRLETRIRQRSLERPLCGVFQKESLSFVFETEGFLMAARRAVFGAVAGLLARDGIPEDLAFCLIFPVSSVEGRLKELAGELAACCRECGVGVSAIEARVSPRVNDLLIITYASGRAADDTFSVKERRNDCDIVCAGYIGLEGTMLIAGGQKEKLVRRYSRSFIEEAGSFYERSCRGSLILAIQKVRKEYGPVRMQASGEGGVFGGLWQLADLAGRGLEADLAAIPVRQHTIELCEFFNLNPYLLFSGGSMLFLCPDGQELLSMLEEEGIAARLIGHTTGSKARLVSYDGEERYLEPPKMDEYYRLLKEIDKGVSDEN